MEENVGKPSTLSKGLIGIILVVIVVLGAGVYEFNKSKSATSPTQAISEETSATIPTTPAMKPQSGSYKDGRYSAQGEYISPGGEEQVGVSVTLQDGKIADINVKSKAVRPTSKIYQGLFVENYKSLVVGKNIDEVKLNVVSGSSLTPNGFNDAIEKIKQQAKA